MPQITTRQVKTRATHECFGCLKEFPEGTQMVASTNVSDNCIYTIYYCLKCDQIMNEHNNEMLDGDDCFYEGCVKEWEREQEIDKERR